MTLGRRPREDVATLDDLALQWRARGRSLGELRDARAAGTAHAGRRGAGSRGPTPSRTLGVRGPPGGAAGARTGGGERDDHGARDPPQEGADVLLADVCRRGSAWSAVRPWRTRLDGARVLLARGREPALTDRDPARPESARDCGSMSSVPSIDGTGRKPTTSCSRVSSKASGRLRASTAGAARPAGPGSTGARARRGRSAHGPRGAGSRAHGSFRPGPGRLSTGRGRGGPGSGQRDLNEDRGISLSSRRAG